VVVVELVVVVVTGALWLKVTVCPAIVKMPVRVAPVVLASAVNVTVPGPVPALPDVMWIHEAVLVAVQAHPVDVVTLTVNDPPVG
jgi:hypothetical protein